MKTEVKKVFTDEVLHTAADLFQIRKAQAMPLYYCLWQFEGDEDQLQQFSKLFFTHYLWGYLTENKVKDTELEKIPLFLRLRDCDLYAILHEEWKSSI